MAKNKSKKIKVILVRGMAGKREKDKKVFFPKDFICFTKAISFSRSSIEYCINQYIS